VNKHIIIDPIFWANNYIKAEFAVSVTFLDATGHLSHDVG
jgi:hypothetical protein